MQSNSALTNRYGQSETKDFSAPRRGETSGKKQIENLPKIQLKGQISTLRASPDKKMQRGESSSPSRLIEGQSTQNFALKKNMSERESDNDSNAGTNKKKM